jgi:transcriptional regulator of met regulon
MSEFETFIMGMVFGAVFLYGFGALLYWVLNRRRASTKEVRRQVDAWIARKQQLDIEQFRRKFERQPTEPDDGTKGEQVKQIMEQEQIKQVMKRMGLGP